MKPVIKNLGTIFKKTFTEWNQKDPFRQSAVIAYYALFSMPGLLVLIITVAGYFFGRDAVSQNILGQIAHTMGPDTAEQIKQILENAGKTKATILGSIIGILILMAGATGVFVELQKTLNLIWQVKVVTKKGILPILKARLFSFGLILAIAFLLLISLVVSAGITAITDMFTSDNLTSIISHVTNFIFSLVIISLLFAMIFKVLPDAKIHWRHVWLGSLVTGLLFTVGKTALTFYFEKAHPGSAYGAAGSIILILLWVSYSSMIMFFGAEFTYISTNILSGKVQPSEIAKKDTHGIP